MTKSNKDLDISVLIATYNRAEILRQTLESINHLDRDGLAVEFVVIDNNSSDHTKEIVKSFVDRLPIRYLFERRPGKNCALNKALNEVPLGKLVVFTDDDVNPRKDWLKAVVSASQRWPRYSVFGGRQFLIYPDGDIPEWARNPKITPLAFGWHDHGDEERPYVQDGFPFGANFWVRREVFAGGIHFDENIGPRPNGRSMGSETTFLKRLAEEGYSMVYCPGAVVGHRVQRKDISIANILRRAWRYGRGAALSRPLCRQDLLNEHPTWWYMVRGAALVLLVVKLVTGILSFSQARRVGKSVDAVKWISYNLESVRVAWRKS